MSLRVFVISGGSTSSGSTSGEKSDISPRGSVENLYEFIKSEAPTPPVSDKKNLYDPVVENNVIGLRPPSMTGSEVSHELTIFVIMYVTWKKYIQYIKLYYIPTINTADFTLIIILSNPLQQISLLTKSVPVLNRPYADQYIFILLIR